MSSSSSSSSSNYSNLYAGCTASFCIWAQDDEGLERRRGWNNTDVRCIYDIDRVCLCVVLFRITQAEINAVATGRFKIAPGLEWKDCIDCTVPGQALVFVAEQSKGITAAQLKVRAELNKSTLPDPTQRIYYDTELLINAPDVALILCLRRGLVVKVESEEDELAGKMDQMQIGKC